MNTRRSTAFASDNVNARLAHDDNPSLSLYQLTELYPDEAAAIAYFEKKRWPSGVCCTDCGDFDVIRLSHTGGSGGVKRSRNSRKAQPTTPTRKRGLWQCRGCGNQFSVTSGTVMDSTKLPLRKWLFAFHLMGNAKKGVSAEQMSREISVSYRTAWHLCHRIRAAMQDDKQKLTGTVEADETYSGGKRKGVGQGYRKNKIPIQTIVSRSEKDHEGNVVELGKAATVVIDKDAENVDQRTVGRNLRKHTVPDRTRLMTDESPLYDKVGEDFKSHDTVHHKKEEYARTDPKSGRLISTNTVEGFTGNLKRQIHGTHHSISKTHAQKYMEEFDFKYNNRDKTSGEITNKAIENADGRVLRLFPSKTGKSLIGPGQSHHGRKRGAPKGGWPKKKKKPAGKSGSGNGEE